MLPLRKTLKLKLCSKLHILFHCSSISSHFLHTERNEKLMKHKIRSMKKISRENISFCWMGLDSREEMKEKKDGQSFSHGNENHKINYQINCSMLQKSIMNSFLLLFLVIEFLLMNTWELLINYAQSFFFLQSWHFRKEHTLFIEHKNKYLKWWREIGLKGKHRLFF